MRRTKNRRKTIIVAGTWTDKSCDKQLQEFCKFATFEGYEVIFITDWKKNVDKLSIENIQILNWPSYTPKKFKDLLFILKLIYIKMPIAVISNFSSVPFVSFSSYLLSVPIRTAFIHSTLVINATPIKWYKILLRRFIYNLNTHIVAVSEEIRIQYKTSFNIYSKKIFVLNNSVYIDKRPDSVKRNKWIVTVAALEHWKGIDILIETFNTIHHDIPDYRLIIIGDGSLRGELIEMVKRFGIEDKVSFLGSIPFTKVLSYLSIAEIFVLPSRADGSPQALLEAAAHGCVVIASAVGGIPSMVIHDKTGLLLFNNDYLELQECILTICQSDEKRVFFRENAYTFILKEFSMNSWSKKLFNILFDEGICDNK